MYIVRVHTAIMLTSYNQYDRPGSGRVSTPALHSTKAYYTTGTSHLNAIKSKALSQPGNTYSLIYIMYICNAFKASRKIIF